MSVSRTSDRHTTHSALLSLISSSATCRQEQNHAIKMNAREDVSSPLMLSDKEEATESSSDLLTFDSWLLYLFSIP